MIRFNKQIEILASSDKEAEEARVALQEMVVKLTPKGVKKMMALYNEDFTIRTIVNSKLSLKS